MWKDAKKVEEYKHFSNMWRAWRGASTKYMISKQELMHIFNIWSMIKNNERAYFSLIKHWNSPLSVTQGLRNLINTLGPLFII